MLKGLRDFFSGLRVLCVKKEQFVALSNEMMKRDIRYSELKAEDDRRSFKMTELEYLKLKKIENFDVFGVETRSRGGIQYVFSRYKRRYGILIGAVLFLLLSCLSTQYVWDIRIEGNDRISDAEIREDLKELGFGVGSSIKTTDFYGICHSLLLLNDGLSWVSVNMEGTYAVVKLIERSEKDIEKNNLTPSNIVAEIDGEIIRTESDVGQLEVKAGQTVSKGELLISGVVKSTIAFTPSLMVG
jgi:similar to stage IV sporulation protein